MTTKSEEFRYWAERSGPKKPKSPPRPKRNAPVDTSKPGVSATDRRAGTPRHESKSVEGKATYAFEGEGAQPSRKSTRKAQNRQRTDGQMQAKRRVSLASPGEHRRRG